jgi:crotonobetainyl-CoA:carnitine CoA-transferase CaiB-like acyl-CoA transferase
MAGEAASGKPVPPMPARESAWGVYETFETKDGGRLFIGITSDNHWRAFCDLFARADLLADPRFATNNERVRNRDALRVYVAEIARTHDVAVLGAMLDRARIPFSPVNTPSDLFADPQVLAHAVDVRMPSGATIPLPPLPLSIDGASSDLRMQPPAAGEHTNAVLSWAGYDGLRIAALREAGVVA